MIQVSKLNQLRGGQALMRAAIASGAFWSAVEVF